MNEFKYITAIVEANFNLTHAAEKLFISQPALSRFVANLEQQHDTILFLRQNGRLVGLTKVGEYYYERALTILAIKNDIDVRLKTAKLHHSGEITIGIPPLIISALFTKFLNDFIDLNPNVKIIILEDGAKKLIEKLEAGILDFAIILHPNSINYKQYEECLIFEDTLAAYINSEHPLAQQNIVSWFDLADYPIATFNDDYMIHHQVNTKFRSLSLTPNIHLEMKSWDFLVSAVRANNMISILPTPSQHFVNMKNVSVLMIEDPIPWKVSMVYRKKEYYSPIEKYLIQCIENHFLNQQSITAFQSE